MKTKYRFKTYLIDACKFEGDQKSAEAIIDWSKGAVWINNEPSLKMTLKMSYQGEVKTCCPGDFIVRGSLPGEFHIEKPTVFHTKYEEVK